MANKQFISVLLASVIPFSTMSVVAEDGGVTSEFSDIYNVTEDDNLAQTAKTNNTNVVAKKTSYTYIVPFDGDIDKSHQIAFDHLVKKLSGDAMSGKDLNFDVDSIIADENILDKGLQITFDEKLAQKLVSDGVLAVWDGLSEPLVGWIARGTMAEEITSVNETGKNVKTQFENEPSLAAYDNSDEFTDALISVGKKKKVQFLLPVNDIDDISAISMQDVLSNNVQAINNASKRYTSGNVVSGVVTRGNDGKYYFSFHVHNLVTGAEALSGDLVGSTGEIATAFYGLLVRHVTELASAVGNSNGQQADKINQDRNVPGLKDNNSAVIQVYGLNSDESRKQVVDNLYSIGVGDVVMRLEGTDVFFDLTYSDGFDCKGKLSGVTLLHQRNDGFTFDYDKGDVAAKESVDNSSALNKKNPYNNEQKPDSEIQPEQGARVRNNNSSRYPDPNANLHTGGGLGHN